MENAGFHVDLAQGLLIRYKGHEPHVVVPEGIRIIDEYAFANHKDLLSVELPSTVTEIRSWSFDRCERLGSIKLPEGLERIGNNAFYACYNLSAMALPATLKYLGESAFWGCINLHSVSLPAGLQEISHCTFKMCLKLKEVEIPESVKSIGRWSFSDCEALQTLTLPQSLEGISDHMLSGCKSLSHLDLPEGITKIGEWAFSGCSALEGLTLPERLEDIGEWAFKGCEGLETIRIPAKVQRIGSNAFHRCSALKRIEVSEANLVYESKKGVLMDRAQSKLIRFPMASGVSEYEIPYGVTHIHDRAFSDCAHLEKVVIPETVQSLGDFAFENCSRLKGVYFRDVLPRVREDTFKKCPELKLHLGLKVFNGSNLHEVVRCHIEDPERVLFPFVSVWAKVPASRRLELEACIESDETEIRLDYAAYVRLFNVVDIMDEKYDLALKRMVYSIALSPDNYEIYHLYLRNNLKKSVWHFIKRHDTQALLQLIEHGVIHSDNIDQMIELANTGKHAELMALLLQYKFEHSSFEEDKYAL
ncbi:leucine-rich repeat domain-containing protein [Acidaminobacter hydrogenoformans]|uniref:Leucine rich repeat-containing protein n=1 Tax=Acidaminobacter hydrogenoformans DSM 2784 TaxID=1120920 RepID=A0A1G5S0N9_9FIRM|nr:leucine-rich repeat domain-containing protein [Acidaminobacter hydrogenoformans]SCZ79687.1 Leucine rich repeat-containing protein [Acidaminobacter hydrogenoformans DSM 2784]